jgi:hypothetical protein
MGYFNGVLRFVDKHPKRPLKTWPLVAQIPDQHQPCGDEVKAVQQLLMAYRRSYERLQESANHQRTLYSVTPSTSINAPFSEAMLVGSTFGSRPQAVNIRRITTQVTINFCMGIHFLLFKESIPRRAIRTQKHEHNQWNTYTTWLRA